MNKETFHLIFLHFNNILGPEIIFSSPGEIPENIREKARNIFSLNIDEHFFEITIENVKITNVFLEIPSTWGRGKVEMAMLSVITDENYDSALFQDLLLDYSEKIKSIQDIYKAFYEDEGINSKEIKIKKEELKELLLECFENLKNTSVSEVEGGKLVQKFKKLSW